MKLKKHVKKKLIENPRLWGMFFEIYKNIWENAVLYHIFTGVGIGGIAAVIVIRSSISSYIASRNTMKAVAGILNDMLLPFSAVFGFIIIMLLVHYFKENIGIFNMFYIFGMRKEDRRLFLVGLFGVAFISSLLIGILFGWIFLHVSGILLSTICKLELKFRMTAVSVGITAALWLVFFLAVMMLSYDNWSARKYKELSNEWIPKKHLKKGMLLGLILTVGLIFIYSKLVRFENKLILLGAMAGTYIFLRCFRAHSVKYSDMSGKIKKVLSKNRIRSHSRTDAIFALLIMVLLLYSVFCSNLQVSTVRTAEREDTLYPYDVVCFAYEEDREVYDQVAERYDLDMMSVPMVRVANMDTTDALESSAQTPIQGQQIGISESSYHFLKQKIDPGYQKRDLQLDEEGEKVYVVHQQDSSMRAQPLDYWLWESQPLLHIGKPRPVGYGTAITAKEMDIGYYFRKISGEEIGSLIGILDCTGKQENIVVFSDGYFEKASQLWKTTNQYTGRSITEEDKPYLAELTKKGVSSLILFNHLEEKDLKDLQKDLQSLEEKHADDFKYDKSIRNAYYKSVAKSDLEQTRLMRLSIGFLQIFLFTMMIVMAMIIEIVTTGDELLRRNTLLRYLGMGKKRRFRLMKNDLLATIHWGELVVSAISVGFLGATFRARMYELEEIKDNIFIMVMIGGVILIVSECLMQLVVNIWIRRAERS